MLFLLLWLLVQLRLCLWSVVKTWLSLLMLLFLLNRKGCYRGCFSVSLFASVRYCACMSIQLPTAALHRAPVAIAILVKFTVFFTRSSALDALLPR